MPLVLQSGGGMFRGDLGEVTSEPGVGCEEQLAKWGEWRRLWVEAVG